MTLRGLHLISTESHNCHGIALKGATAFDGKGRAAAANSLNQQQLASYCSHARRCKFLLACDVFGIYVQDWEH